MEFPAPPKRMTERQKAIFDGATQIAAAYISKAGYSADNFTAEGSQLAVRCLQISAKIYDETFKNVKP